MLLRSAVWTVLLALGLCANADARLLLLASQDSSLYRSFQQGFEVGLNALTLPATQRQEFVFTLASDYRSGDEADSEDVIIAAGVEAAKKVASLNIGDSRVIYTMLPLTSYRWLGDNKMLVENHKVLFIDQPPHRYVNLIQAALPSIGSLGYLYGEVSAEHIDGLKQAADEKQIGLNANALQPRQRLEKTLLKLMLGNDAILVLPDPYMFNRRTIQRLLLASLRRRTPLIAYSESYVKAGALLALFTSPKQIGRQTAELAHCMVEACADNAEREYFPKYFSVRANAIVARQFGIDLPSEDVLAKQLELSYSNKDKN